MRVYGRASVHTLLGDRVVYRSLNPVDARLPRWSEIASDIGCPKATPPRKSDPDYGRAVAHLLRAARRIESPGTPIERLVYLGDTRRNDGTAFRSICFAGGWDGLAFIGHETSDPPQVEVIDESSRTLVYANRWSELERLDAWTRTRGFSIDARTAVVVDLDKTLLGARGRNDGVIDTARRSAARATVGAALGDAFSAAAFDAAYDRLNRADCHGFTQDNQDVLVYVCVIVVAGLMSLDDLLAWIRAEPTADFLAFLDIVDAQRNHLTVELADLHRVVRQAIAAGDPTPFKAFRRRELLQTATRMGTLGSDVGIDERLRSEIVMTHEVYDVATHWRARGALLMGLSDKPDEACIPRSESAMDGQEPLHRIETYIVGEDANRSGLCWEA